MDQALPKCRRFKLLHQRWQFLCSCERCLSRAANDLDGQLHGYACPETKCVKSLCPLSRDSSTYSVPPSMKQQADVEVLSALALLERRDDAGEVFSAEEVDKLSQVLCVEHPLSHSVGQASRLLRNAYVRGRDYEI